MWKGTMMILKGCPRFFSSRVFFFFLGGGGSLESFPEIRTKYKGAIKEFQFLRHLINLYTMVLHTVVFFFGDLSFKKTKGFSRNNELLVIIARSP